MGVNPTLKLALNPVQDLRIQLLEKHARVPDLTLSAANQLTKPIDNADIFSPYPQHL